MAVKSIIIGSTGNESSMPGNSAIFTAKGVSSAMQSRPISRRAKKNHTVSSANGIIATEASPMLYMT